MSFAVLPPEINSARLYVGAGLAPMLDAAAAWDGLADELGSAAASFSAVTAGLAGSSWLGAASTAMTERPPLSGLVERGGGAGPAGGHPNRLAAAAFEAALAATVHPAIISANRALFASLVVSNLLGQNAPAIAGHRGRLRADVGPGRGGDVWLPCRGLGGRLGVDTVRPALTVAGGGALVGAAAAQVTTRVLRTKLGERRRGQRR
ncbi:PPE family protein [Mycobacterium tuberculosis]|uniref:PPE family protein n=1 Tax=Mycobacterium tuberculosis TaxID=1773 RepID=UPI0032B3C60B